jgi:hypothetical protein
MIVLAPFLLQDMASGHPTVGLNTPSKRYFVRIEAI